MNSQKVETQEKCHAELGSASNKSLSYETLKQVQGDKSGLFSRP